LDTQPSEMKNNWCIWLETGNITTKGNHNQLTPMIFSGFFTLSNWGECKLSWMRRSLWKLINKRMRFPVVGIQLSFSIFLCWNWIQQTHSYCEGVFDCDISTHWIGGGAKTQKCFLIYKPPLDTSIYFLTPPHFLYKYIQYGTLLCVLWIWNSTRFFISLLMS